MVDIQYKELVKNILDNGEETSNRTDTNTIHIVSERIKVDISEHLACITLKQMAVKTTIRELIWFLRGSTNTNELAEMNCHIWEANTSREELDKNGFECRPTGEGGPIYGAQWRGVGGRSRYGQDKPDQFRQAISDLRHNPTSRRIIVQSWNVKDLPKMALPPCHYCIQFLVWKSKLQTIVSQRSADVFLGVPFNLLSYSILAHLVGIITNLQPDTLTINFGDAHIYVNHIDQCKEILTRETLTYPRISFSDRVNSMRGMDIDAVLEIIDKLELDDFIIEGLECHGKLVGKMAV